VYLARTGNAGQTTKWRSLFYPRCLIKQPAVIINFSREAHSANIIILLGDIKGDAIVSTEPKPPTLKSVKIT
jgi:hypothetical protein